MTPPRDIGLASLVLTVTLAIGCGGEPPQVPRFPASGTVLLDGRPAKGVQVMLYPAERLGDLDALKPIGVTGEDGVFRLGTYEKADGAPAGRYKVTLFLPDEPPNGSNSPDDLLGGRYLDAGRSAFEVDIAEGENQLAPFEVRKARRPARSAQSKKTPKPDFDGVG